VDHCVNLRGEEMAGQAGWYRSPSEDGMLRYWNGTAWTDHRQPVPALVPPTPVAQVDPDPMAEYERQFESSTDTKSMIDQLSFVLDQRQFDPPSASPRPHYEPASPIASIPQGQLASTVLAPAPRSPVPDPTVLAPTPAPAPAPALVPAIAPVAQDAAERKASADKRKRVLVTVRGMWIGIVIVVIGFVVTGLMSANIFSGPGQLKASGIVTSLGSTADNSCTPIARFAVTGRSYTASASAVSPCPVGLGQSVDIFYSPADPGTDGHIVIGSGISQYAWAIPLLGALLFVGSLVTFIVRAGSIAGGIALVRDGNKRSKRTAA
jgi:hypothetical protein